MQRESLQSPAGVSSSHATEEDAVRMASASLHSSIRKFRQICLPLLAPQSKGLPVKHTVKVFVSRMTEEMTASALECLRVLPRDRVLSEKRRRDLLQWLSISPTSNNNGGDATPLSLMFLNDLKERLTLHYAEAAGGAASRLTMEPTTETLTCVPAVVVLRVAEQLWAQRQTSTAERLLWKDGVEELLTVGGEQEETSGTLPAESFLRKCVVLSKTEDAPLSPSPTSTTSQSLLAAIVELWAWCKATDNINAEEEVESALQEQTTKSLLACWFPAGGAADDAWQQVMSRVMQRVSSLQQRARKRNATTVSDSSPAVSPSRQQLRDQLLTGAPARPPNAPEVATAVGSSTSNKTVATTSLPSPTRVVQGRGVGGLWTQVSGLISRLSERRFVSAGAISVVVAVVVLVVQLLLVRYTKASTAPTTRRALSL